MLKKRKVVKFNLSSKSMKRHSQIRKKFVWQSSKGSKHVIKDMDKNYIKNCIAKVERGEIQGRSLEIYNLKNELLYRELENESIKDQLVKDGRKKIQQKIRTVR